MEIIGELVKELRGNQTQKEFAKKIGISRSYLSDLESSRKSPSLATLSKLAKACGKEVHIEFVDNKNRKG